MAARQLQAAGHAVLVVDKGRSVGGRLATRRIGNGAADHGAQYFTARSPEFQAQIDQWVADDLVYLWTMGFTTDSLTGNDPVGHARYAVRGGMNKLAKHLAAALEVEVSVRIASLALVDGRWLAHADNGDQYGAAAVIMTPPVPQTLAILDSGRVVLAADERVALDRIIYSPCIAGIFRYEGEITIPAPGAVHRSANTVPWIADNQQKGLSPTESVVTLHADPDYSRRYWDAPDLEIVETLQEYMHAYLTPSSNLVETQIKRWRYSIPDVIHEAPTLVAAGLPPLAFAGDAFGGPRVEGAYLSGQAAGAAILAALADGTRRLL